MEFLRNLQDFEIWKANLVDDVSDTPDEFPCFVYSVVTSWGDQESASVYLYAKNLRSMLYEIEKEVKVKKKKPQPDPRQKPSDPDSR